jgi:CHASE3 domain sensor protein
MTHSPGKSNNGRASAESCERSAKPRALFGRLPLPLMTQLSSIVVGMLALIFVICVLGMLLGFQASRIVDNVAVENLARMEAAAHLESALLEQKGYVTAYVLSGGDQKWLVALAEKQPAFSEWLARAREGAQAVDDKSILARLEQAASNTKRNALRRLHSLMKASCSAHRSCC